MLNTFFPILATEYAGLSAAQAGGLYAIGGLAALAGPGFGWLSDHVSRALVLQLRGAANVLSSVLYLVSPTLAGFARAAPSTTSARPRSSPPGDR